jgi:glycosyltransferase involved in cell wall biosynthesis
MSCGATIVLPLLRQVDEWLDQALQSALLQSASTEVVVVRSERTPPSNLQVLTDLGKHFVNLAVFLRDKPESFPGAINKGFRYAKSDRVGLLLSDDWLDEHAVAECLLNDTDIVSTGSTTYFPNGRVNGRACRHRSINEFNALPTLEEKANYLGHFLMFRRQFVLDAGGLDESIGNYPGIDDFDLLWTLLEHQASVSIVEKQLYHYRDHDCERLTLQDKATAIENFRKILRKHGVSEDDVFGLVGRYGRWFGKPIYRVINDSE